MNARWAAVVFALAVAGALSAPAAEDGRQRVFAQALDEFDRARKPEDYDRAARLYESLLTGGYENAAVLYNLGNACVSAGRTADAIAAYRRAQRLRPRDPYIAANLDAVRALAPGTLPPDDPPWWRRVLFWHALLSQGERHLAACAAWGLLFVLAAARVLLRRPDLPLDGVKWAARAACVLALLLTLSAALGYHADVLARRGVVAREVTVRKGNGEAFAPAFDRPLKEGAEFTVIEARGEWVWARFSGSGDGWLPEKAAVLY